MPISSSVLALFIAYLFLSQYAPSTVMKYVTALGYCHKLQGFSDTTQETLYTSARGVPSFPTNRLLGCVLASFDKQRVGSIAFVSWEHRKSGRLNSG